MTTKNFDDLATLNNGTPIKTLKDGVEIQTSFSLLIADALGASYPSDANLSSMEIYKRGKLADKIEIGGDIDLKSDEITLIKDIVAKRWAPRVTAAVYDKIEADYIPKEG